MSLSSCLVVVHVDENESKCFYFDLIRHKLSKVHEVL